MSVRASCSSSCYPSSVCAEWSPCVAYRYGENERNCSFGCILTGNRCRYREDCEILFRLCSPLPLWNLKTSCRKVEWCFTSCRLHTTQQQIDRLNNMCTQQRTLWRLWEQLPRLCIPTWTFFSSYTDIHRNITAKQGANFRPSFRELDPGQQVYFLLGVIAVRLGDLPYEVEYAGKRFKHHIDQIRSRIGTQGSQLTETTTYSADWIQFLNLSSTCDSKPRPWVSRSKSFNSSLTIWIEVQPNLSFAHFFTLQIPTCAPAIWPTRTNVI